MSTAPTLSATNMLLKLEQELTEFRKMLGSLEAGPIERAIKKDIAEVLETEPLQFLKQRFQLGLLMKVAPEWKHVKHTRLDHTVGVVAKCIIACDIINKNTLKEIEITGKDLDREITSNDARELAVAAALHDCGHFPVSHATERAFLTATNTPTGVKHEERIIPLIIASNPVFDELRNIVLGWDGFDENSFYKIASIISHEIGTKYVGKIKNFILPKRVLQQLLVSELDMDRLDYVLRDSRELKYTPVSAMADKIVKYVNGLSLEKSKIIGGGSPDNNCELSLLKELKSEKQNYLESAFYLLVSRVLLYKYIYFSEKLRSFEAILTYLVGTLLSYNISFEPLKLIAMSDEYFIDTYLSELVDYIDETEDKKRHLKEKYINVLINEKVQRFKLLFSIDEKYINYPSIKEEFKKNVNKRNYIDNLRTYIEKSVEKKSDDTDEVVKMQRSDILLDVFHLKTGGGDLIVKSRDKDGHNKTEYKTLKDYMNGSNMHRLCSETRLDVYMKSDLGDKKKILVVDRLTSFFKYKKDELQTT